jgi:hypothetical protein
MRMRNLQLATLAMLGLVGVTAPSHAGLVLDLTGGGTSEICGTGCGASGTTLGWAFTVNSPIKVDGIGVWDSFGSSFPSTEAGLWSVSTAGATLVLAAPITSASAPVASADSSGHWLFESFSPSITLAPGVYVIGNVFFADEPLARVGASETNIPEITPIVGGVIGSTDGGLTAPLTPLGFPGPTEPAIFGPALETVAVPEASTWAMMLLGFAGLGFMGLQSARRRAAAH